MNRRSFSQLVALGLLGLLVPRSAFAGSILHRRVHLRAGGGSSAAPSWSTWNELSESGLADDDTFVVMLEQTGAGGNETGQGGGLSGANLVLTDASANIAGATGSPPRRAFTSGANRSLIATATCLQTFFNANPFTCIIKANNLANAAASLDPIINLYGTKQLQLGITSSAQTLYGYVQDNGNTYINGSTASAIPTTGDVWLAIMVGSGYIRAGFSTTKPTKWSDFAAGDRLSASGTYSSTNTWATDRQIMGMINGRVTFSGYYVVLSKKELINPNT